MEGLAESSGVSARAISDMERGLSRAPWPRTVNALVSALAHPDAGSLTALARQGRDASPAPRRRPAGLPRADGLFIGRDEPIARIADHAASSTPVAVVHGPPGVGKSALALRLADRHAGLFPDGRFHLDLRGGDAEPADLQGVLLRALSISPRQISADPEERTGQLRDVLRQRRCLIILDDAAGEAQVRPLLPAAGPSLALITSRQSLGGLEAVLRVALEPFSPAESAELLREVAGPGAGSDEDVARVAYLCGHLPLALRIAGRPGGSMASLATRLADADRRLSTLGVETAFTVSYRRLPEPARLLFRRLAHLVPGSFSATTVAVLAECDPYDAEDVLEDLVERGLARPEGYARYRLHDLLRLFAGDRLRAEEPAEVRAAVRRRLHRWYLDTTIAAGRWFEPEFGHAPDGWDNPVPLDTAEQARYWLQSELEGWHAALRTAAESGEHQRVVDVAGALHWYSDRTLSTEPWTVVFGLSRAAAARLPDRRQEADHCNFLSWAYVSCENRYAEGRDLALEAHRLAKQVGDARAQAESLFYAANAVRLLGDLETAGRLCRQSLALAEACGDHDGYVNTMVLLGTIEENRGRSAEAVAQYRRTLYEVERRPLSPSPRRAARLTASIYLAQALCDAGRWAEALVAAEAARPLAEEFGEARFRGQAAMVLGWACAATGDTERGQALLREASGLLGGSA